MPFKPGQSGNPKGRPPKGRALTEILERRGNKTVPDIDGRNHGGKYIVARALWELATTGRTSLKDGDEVRELSVGAKGWFEIVKWMYAQVDGPPKGEMDVTSGGKPLAVVDFTKLTVEQLEVIAKGGTITDALRGRD